MQRLSRIVLGSTLITLSSTSRTIRGTAGIHNAATAFLIKNNNLSPSLSSHRRRRRRRRRRRPGPDGNHAIYTISQPQLMMISNNNFVDDNLNATRTNDEQEEENNDDDNNKDDDEGQQQQNQNRQRNDKILPYVETSHNSVTITIPNKNDKGNENNILFQPQYFSTSLANTISVLRGLDKSSIWVEVPMSRASLIEEIETSNLGFQFHHAEGNTAKLNAWLRDDIPSKVPEFATHHVGVGAVVINSRDEILCIRELRKNYHPWKIPTGLAELGESIHDAAEREVLEETGIAATCHNVLSIRHSHGMSNGRSDLFFICRLIPNNDEDDDGNGNNNIRTPVPQACEIAEAKWLPLSEYRDMIDGLTEDSNGHPVMSFVMDEIFDKGTGINMQEVDSVIPGCSPTPLYFPDITNNNIQ
jgi:ADP-ribose pyrophosphatase YjhB (NUDIX family)